MNAGTLDQRVSLQAPAISRSAGGHLVTTYATQAIVWAKIRYLRGREYHEAQQTSSEVSMEITIRFRRELPATWRVKHCKRYYEIVSVTPARKKGELLLMCRDARDV